MKAIFVAAILLAVLIWGVAVLTLTEPKKLPDFVNAASASRSGRVDDIGVVKNINPSTLHRGTHPSWQDSLIKVLQADDSPSVVAFRLKALIPSLPLEGQLEVAQHIVDLLSDENYGLARDIYFDPETNAEVRRVIYLDFMNRTNTLKLPLLVQTLRAESHPLRAESIASLQLFVGEDVGDDPDRWVAVVNSHLQKEARDFEQSKVKW